MSELERTNKAGEGRRPDTEFYYFSKRPVAASLTVEIHQIGSAFAPWNPKRAKEALQLVHPRSDPGWEKHWTLPARSKQEQKAEPQRSGAPQQRGFFRAITKHQRNVRGCAS
jgi:hypothetical protein